MPSTSLASSCALARRPRGPLRPRVLRGTSHKSAPSRATRIQVFDGCICCNTSLYTDIPACIGCSSELKFLCLECNACCKMGAPLMLCLCCELKCGAMDVLWKSQAQACCLVESCACPPGGEVPMMFGKCFIVCYPKFGVCKPQGELMSR